MTKPELLSPAGDMEKLKVAIAFGADAVYMGGHRFSLRANAKNFNETELGEAITYAHDKNVKVYVGVNIFAHNKDLNGLADYLRLLNELGADAVIVTDPGVFDIATQIKGLNIHISTQANVTNYQSALFYRKLGASRVILARDLSFSEIRDINHYCKAADFETEVFVHGAMCMSYSGRCLLSSYLTGRDANKGDCAHLCRANYYLMEEKRPGEYLPVYEDDRGTYLFNAKDLCMIEHIPELVKSGVASLKIEGRMKTIYYLAAVTRAYRQAIDDFFVSESLYETRKTYYLQELIKTATRDFCTGFYFGRPTDGQSYGQSKNPTSQDFLGIVTAYDAERQQALVEQRNKFSVGDEVTFLKGGFTQVLTVLNDKDGVSISVAPHPQQLIWVKVARAVEVYDLMIRNGKT